MDPISYGVAAKQKQRIEKVIAEPDSTSGVITVPQVITAGETITIPAGRVAVLPNVQVDGVLDVHGEVFIPSGSGLSTVVQKSGDTMTGNLNFASGTKITGDFSNATASSRTKIQSSIPNGNSNVEIIPNGTASQALLRISNSSNTANYNVIDIVASGASTRIQTAGIGTNQHTPLEFWVSGNEKMRIDTAGNVGIGTSSNIDKLTVKGNISVGSFTGTTASDGAGVLFFRGADQSQMGYVGFGAAATPFEFVNSKNNGFNFYNGDVLQKTAYGLGYGTGAGGTVTQLTNKSTAVTLNKPCGYITMNGAALAAGAIVTFIFNNSIISYSDQILITRATTGTTAGYNVWIDSVGAGACTIVVKNITGVSLSEAIVLSYSIIKGAGA